MQKRRDSTSSSRVSGKMRPLGKPPRGMFRAADALEQSRDRTRRAQLANEIDRTDVDAEFERRGRDEGFEFAAFQSIFGVEAEFGGETSVMRRDLVGAKKFAQMMRHALGHAARVHEHERRAVFLNQFGEA